MSVNRPALAVPETGSGKAPSRFDGNQDPGVGFGQPIPEVPQKLRIVGPHIETITGFLKQTLGDGVAKFPRIVISSS